MSGDGAHAVGGRWNSRNHQVVYTCGNLSLAMLELLVHVGDASELSSLEFVFHEVTFPIDALAILREEDVPTGWNSQPVSTVSQVVGDQWLEAQESVALAVLSVHIPQRYRYDPLYMNYLVNPRHPDFRSLVETGELFDLELDDRLLK